MIQPIPIALVIAAVLLVAWRLSGQRSCLILGVLWLAYAGYEFLMYRRVLCSGECNIRLDLLLIYPALLGSTLWVALAALVRAIRRQRSV